MKKLVKTAKQQFEERRKKLTYRYQYKLSETEIYYAYEGVNAYFYILREHNGEYKEIAFGEQYEAFVFSEIFLGTMAEYFRDHNLHIKPLFDWYASADHDCEPFTLMDIWMLDLNKAECVYEDIYEEVSDVRIITAKEQWEEDSKNAKIAATLGNGSIYKVNVTEQAITFYVFKGDCYTKSVFPPLSELRKDNKFIIKYLELVRMSHDGDMDYALSWLAGGEYKMCELSLLDIYESATEVDGLEYEDKELPQEQSIEQMLELTQEQKDALKAFEEASDKLRRSGVMLVSYWDENEFYAINGGTQLKFDSLYDYKEGEYVDISNVLVKKHRCEFGWDLYWGVDCCFCAKKF